MSRVSGPYIGVALVLMCCMSARASEARHRLAKENAEEVLAGVVINANRYGAIQNEDGVYAEPIDSVLKKMGKPRSVTSTGECESNYVWIKDGVRIEAGTGCVIKKIAGKDLLFSHGVYSIEIWGTKAAAGMPGTGRGLALGDDLMKVKRLYGRRCNVGRYTYGTGTQNTHGLKYAYYASCEWDGNVELDVDAGVNRMVNHIQLRASAD